jgi:hypothetical protein
MHNQFFPRTLSEAFPDERFPAVFGPYRRSSRCIVRAAGFAALLVLLVLGALGAQA